jgi:hypothetical protein
MSLLLTSLSADPVGTVGPDCPAGASRGHGAVELICSSLSRWLCSPPPVPCQAAKRTAGRGGGRRLSASQRSSGTRSGRLRSRA